MSAYLCKTAIDGFFINLDMPKFHGLPITMKRVSTDKNQITKRLNEDGRIYKTDIEGIKKN